MAQYFPYPRRIVTGHDSEGNAVVLKDSEISCNPVGPSANFAHLWLSEQFPASIEGGQDPVEEFSPGLFSDDGIKLRVVDVPAHTETLVHRTVTLDFAILFEGEIDCHLDKGVVVHMKPGDTLIQRGTIHGWTNPGTRPARIYFVIMGAKPVTIAGKDLGRTGL